jgi:hypothetical protein
MFARRLLMLPQIVTFIPHVHKPSPMYDNDALTLIGDIQTVCPLFSAQNCNKTETILSHLKSWNVWNLTTTFASYKIKHRQR